MKNNNQNKMLIVNNNLKTGGVQKALVNLLNEIKNEYSITLFLFSKNGEYLKDVPKEVNVIEATSILKILGLSLYEAKSISLRYYFAKIYYGILTKIFNNKLTINILIKKEPKLAGYNYAISYLHSSPIKNLYGGTNEFLINRVIADKKIAFVHCDFRNYGGNINYAELIYSKFNTVAFCSQGCLDSFDNKTLSLKNKSIVVYNCQNYAQIMSYSKVNVVNYDKEYYNIVLISRLSEEKGIEKAIEAIELCNREYGVKLRIHIIGDGKQADDYRQLVIKLRIIDFVKFYGNQENPYSYMVNANLLLSTSYHEAAPMIFGEAYALGLPILTTKTTSTDELITKKNAGWVCSSSINDIVINLYNISQGIWSLNNSKLNITELNNNLALEQFRQCLVNTRS